MFKLQILLHYHILKNHIENKAKGRAYYNHLPKPVIEGFTLAEVLITLTIVGIIASLTIPSLVNNVNNATNVAKLKKEYSVLQQAFNLVATDAGGSILNDPNINSATGDAATDANAMNTFASKLNIVKNCGSAVGCWYASPLKYLGGGIYKANLELNWADNFGKAIMADGTMILVNIDNTGCTSTRPLTPEGSPLYGSICGEIYIDINGDSSPNQEGRDVFVFWITKTGIYPRGIFYDGNTCEMDSSTYITSVGCAGKVLTEGAMNY